jgi:hypothetical protein
MSHDIVLKAKARKLRLRGYSYREISILSEITKSTAYEWLKDVSLNKTAKQRIERLKTSGRNRANNTRHIKRLKLIKSSEKWARNVLKSVHLTPELSQIYCSLLYWAEGGKTSDNRLEFTNSDPAMIKTFLKLLRLGFNIDENKLRVNIHIHEYHNEARQKVFWSKVTNIPLQKFNQSYLKPHTKKIIRENYQGCARICYHSGETAKKIRALYIEFSKI